MINLRLRIERFLRASRMAHTTFGRLAVNDPNLVRDIRNGRELYGTARRVEEFLAVQEQLIKR